jgi:hypothetical protein
MQIKDYNIRYANKEDYLGIVELVLSAQDPDGIENPDEKEVLEMIEDYTSVIGAYVYVEKKGTPVGYATMIFQEDFIDLGRYFVKKGEDENFLRTQMLNEQKDIAKTLGAEMIIRTVVRDGPLKDYTGFLLENNFYIEGSRDGMDFLRFDVPKD